MYFSYYAAKYHQPINTNYDRFLSPYREYNKNKINTMDICFLTFCILFVVFFFIHRNECHQTAGYLNLIAFPSCISLYNFVFKTKQKIC